VQRQLVFDYWGPLHFQLSLWQAVVAVIAIAVLAVAAFKALPHKARGDEKDRSEQAPEGRRGLRFNMALLAGITAGAMLLQLDLSRPFWNVVPLVRFIQFPWRLLGIAAFCIAILAGYLFTCGVPSPSGPPSHRGEAPGSGRRPLSRLAGIAGWTAAAGFLIVILYASTYMLAPQFDPYTDQLSEEAVSVPGLFERGRSYFTLFSDFLPAGVKMDPLDLLNPRAARIRAYRP